MTESHKEKFLSLLEPIHTRLWRFCLSITKTEIEAEDLLSDTVLAAFERFESLRDPQAFVSFLFTIATRIHRHDQLRQRKFDVYDQEYAESIPSSYDSPELAADIRIIRDALALLPEKHRETIVLFEITGFSLQEIRGIQGGTLSGVKSRLRRARKELSKILGVHLKPDARSQETTLFRKRTANLQATIAIISHE
jgi:RNA polymerase sigma-70 factor (ECF subfamily)